MTLTFWIIYFCVGISVAILEYLSKLSLMNKMGAEKQVMDLVKHPAYIFIFFLLEVPLFWVVLLAELIQLLLIITGQVMSKVMFEKDFTDLD